jgi:hypothetical protein
MKLETAEKLQQIIDKDSTIELIEIWSNVLYIRRSKGRNTFFSKKGIEEVSGVYINLFNFTKEEFKRLQKKYHPDINKGKASYVYISKSINQWKELLLEHLNGELTRSLYQQFIDSCRQQSSIFTALQSISTEWCKTTGFFHGVIQRSQDPIAKAKARSWIEEDLKWMCS